MTLDKLQQVAELNHKISIGNERFVQEFNSIVQLLEVGRVHMMQQADLLKNLSKKRAADKPQQKPEQ